MANHTISANTLFHFTKSISNLSNILTHTFSPKYCLEHISLIPEDNLDLAIPMVCFCDIPLSQIKDHVDTYGEYAIGLSKEWAMSNGISPILYLYNNSFTHQILDKLFNAAFSLDKLEYSNSKNVNDSSILSFFSLVFHTKPYIGKMWRDGKLKGNTTFYNEREWRFVPNISDLESFKARLSLRKDEYVIESERKKYNAKLEAIKIRFTPNDIKYIIVSKESERLRMVEMIEGIKLGTYSTDEIKELNSKILSVEQIKEDF